MAPDVNAMQLDDVLFSRAFPPITRHLLALYCGASGDTNAVHVDIDAAKAAGFDDVFAQGMLVMALLGRSLTDAVPPERMRSFSSRFLARTQIGAELVCEGRIVSVERSGAQRLARVALTVRDQNDDMKISGFAEIDLTDRP